jgi:hypothetical protein
MTRTTVSEVLAMANAAMVGADLDVTGALARLLTGVTASLPASGAAILVDADGTLEVLAATSHRTLDLEMHQAQVDEGPCVDALRTGVEVHEVGADALVARWPQAGPSIVASGYRAVQALPLAWHGESFGALNVFREDPVGFQAQQPDCRALADAVTLLIVSAHVDPDHLAAGLRVALEDRAVVELAKGALAHTRSLDMSDAYDALMVLADDEQVSLGVAAHRVMDRARAGTLDARPAGS